MKKKLFATILSMTVAVSLVGCTSASDYEAKINKLADDVEELEDENSALAAENQMLKEQLKSYLGEEEYERVVGEAAKAQENSGEVGKALLDIASGLVQKGTTEAAVEEAPVAETAPAASTEEMPAAEAVEDAVEEAAPAEEAYEETAESEVYEVKGLKMTDIKSAGKDNAEYFFTCKVNGEEMKGSIINYQYPDLGYSAAESVGVGVVDVDKDGSDELVFNVYAIGNTLSELCGNLHVLKVTDDGFEEILNHDDGSWNTPDENWIFNMTIDEGDLYLTTGTKEVDDDGYPSVVTTIYRLEYDGSWQAIEEPNMTFSADSEQF